MENLTDPLAARRARRAAKERLYRTTPEYREKYLVYKAAKSSYDKERRKTPEYRRKHAAHKKTYDAKPETKLKRIERSRRYNGHPDPTRPRPVNCECCDRAQRYVLALDHCHVTGRFRGWLCHQCNAAIGALGDNSIRVARAVAYLIDAERQTGLIPKL